MTGSSDASPGGPRRPLAVRGSDRVERSRPTGSRRLRALLAAIVLAAAAGGALGALAAGVLDGRDAATAPRAASQSRQSATARTGIGGGSSTALAGPSGDPGAFYAGRAMRGNGDSAIPLSRAQALAAELPAGAVADRSTRTLRFRVTDASFVVLASPPGHDMTFRIAGMTDPTIDVPRGAHVTVEFINGDNDMAHMWLLARDLPASGEQPAGGRPATIAAARPLGDPTAAGQPEETIAFPAPPPGSYRYYCAFPGHAGQGMQGRLLVERP